ncbi:dynein heavy chain 12, axonemal-like [Megalops cyprinoides]|uniref:dynein heavy chain 12, axonemal-like n=1 Tax=Megalops cyprinoides TaxID=118141 RepID=UPI001864E250|nr:dynein heavy chain 12, axonemal-like [Megalops cyprinoides]
MDSDLTGHDADEDAALQLAIQQSLLDCDKHGGREVPVPEVKCRIPTNTTEKDKIFAAIKRGDEAALRKLAVCQQAFGEVDNRGWIPLHEAAVQNNMAILEITFAASPTGAGQTQTLQGKTPLFLAVEKGLEENVIFLLQNGCSPNTQDEDEDSPLVAAIKTEQYDMAVLLLRFNARVNQEGAHRRTPLHEAARLGREKFVNLLLEAGADPDPRSAFGLTPLALAAQGGHLEIVRVLLQKGADVESQASDSATILFEAAASGNAEVISLLLDYGADPNVPKHTGHLPIHRVAHRGHLQALECLIPVTTFDAVEDSGMSPLHSAAAGGHAECLRLLLSAGYDVNFMLEPWVRRNYDDQRKSALYFAVSNNDMHSVRLLLEAGAMPNQDPVKCLQVALRLGNYKLISTLLRYGANVNYYSRVNTTHFPSALQYALKDEVVLRMLLNYGYDVKRCFDCPYGEGSHVPHDYEGWTPSVIKDMMFCEVITVYWLRDISAHIVRIMLDYVDHVTFCSKLRAALVEQAEWPDICKVQSNPRCLQHLCRLKIRDCLGRLRLRAPIFMSFLPLPCRLKDYILYREYDLYTQGGTTTSQ